MKALLVAVLVRVLTGNSILKLGKLRIFEEWVWEPKGVVHYIAEIIRPFHPRPKGAGVHPGHCDPQEVYSFPLKSSGSCRLSYSQGAGGEDRG